MLVIPAAYRLMRRVRPRPAAADLCETALDVS
jgi:hypothetical protein